MKIGFHIIQATVMAAVILLPALACRSAVANQEAVPASIISTSYSAEAHLEWGAITTLALHSGSQSPTPSLLPRLPSTKPFADDPAAATASPGKPRNGLEPLALVAFGVLLIGVSAQGRKRFNLSSGNVGHENDPPAPLWRKTLQH